MSSVPAPASSVSSTKTAYYQPELDVLRFVAFMLVFWHHAGIYKLGASSGVNEILTTIVAASGVGLQVFFLLSSYLITELLLRERAKLGTINLPAFFARRILRIWPLYFLFLLGTFAAAPWLGGARLPTAGLAAYLLLCGNWFIYLHGFVGSVATPLWSISVEEQYYVVWPILARFQIRRTLWTASIVFLVISSVALYYSGVHAVPLYAYWTNSFVEFRYFALGAILSLTLRGRMPELTGKHRLLILLVGALALWIAVTHFGVMMERANTAGHLISGFFFVDIAVVALFVVFLGLKIPPHLNSLAYLGRISYGLYVFHSLALGIVMKGLARLLVSSELFSALGRPFFGLILTIMFAATSYKFIEMPFLQLKQRFTFIHTR